MAQRSKLLRNAIEWEDHTLYYERLERERKRKRRERAERQKNKVKYHVYQ